MGEIRDMVDQRIAPDAAVKTQLEIDTLKSFVEASGDVYSSYLTAEEWESTQVDSDGSYCGIGVQIMQDPETMEEPRWLIQYSLKVLDAYTGPAFTGGPVITRITAADDSYQMTVRLLVPGSVDKIAANRRVSFIGVPLQLSSYTTVLGTENTCIVVVAGDVLVTG